MRGWGRESPPSLDSQQKVCWILVLALDRETRLGRRSDQVISDGLWWNLNFCRGRLRAQHLDYSTEETKGRSRPAGQLAGPQDCLKQSDGSLYCLVLTVTAYFGE